VYCANLAVELFGVPDEIVAARMTRLRGGIDGAGIVLLAYGEATVELAYSKITDSRACSEVQGEDATLVLDQAHNPRRLCLADRHGTTAEVEVDKPDDNMVFELAEFARLVQTGGSADRWNDVTEARLRLTDAVRALLGLVFPADEPRSPR
jgi:predicted dehydrogenase